MKLAKISGTLGLVVLAVIASPFAMADDSGWYGGINVGQGKAKIDNAKITSGLQERGYATTSITDDNRDTGAKIFGGYKFGKNFALEGGYFDLGEFGFTANTLPAGTLNGKIKLRGLNIDAVGILPVTEKFSVFGRLGLNYAQARDSFSGIEANINPSPSKRDTNYKAGVGVQYDFTEALAMRVEAERYRINDAIGNKGDIDLVSLGLVYRFGAKTPAPAPTPKAAEPLPVAVAPAPRPVAVTPPPPPPVLTKVTFSADSLFDFGKATMKPAGKEALDKFSADLRGTDYEVITVTGHTDRIGSHEYNMKLSTHRAETVQMYLVESAGIPIGKIAAKGVDGSDPVTKPGECKGTKRTKKLIACLQPDRRVEVEVTAIQVSR